MIRGLTRIGVNNDWLLRAVDYYLQRHNLGKRGKGDGSPEEQRAGLIGQMTVHKLLKGVYPDLNTVKDGFDGGFDLLYRGCTIDVKTKQRNVYVQPHYSNSLFAFQKDYDCDIFIFCSLHKKDLVLEICGWIWKQDFLKTAKFIPAGTKIEMCTYRYDDYQILNTQLQDISTIRKINLLNQ